MTPSGEPDLRLEGLSLWVHGRERPDDTDFWDSYWLVVTAVMTASGSRVQVGGPLIRTTELVAFLGGLRTLNAKLVGKAELDCLEPGLHVTLEGVGLGHIAGKVEITPDQLTQSHSFEFGTDQTFLSPVIAGCESLLEKYPVRGSAAD